MKNSMPLVEKKSSFNVSRNAHHYKQVSPNMASKPENEPDCFKHCWGVYEQNSIMNKVSV